MSQSSHFVEGVRGGLKLGRVRLVDFLSEYILPDAGPMAENVVERYGISRNSKTRSMDSLDKKKSAGIIKTI